MQSKRAFSRELSSIAWFTCTNFRQSIAAAVHTNGYQENASSDSKIMASVAIAAGVSIIIFIS
jgi:hypothetical protein